MLSGNFWEQKKRVRSMFAEVHFLLMRYQRYGISNCTNCGDADLLAAQLETLNWQEEKEAEEAAESES